MRYSYNNRPPKVEQAASKDAARPVLAHIYFDAERGELQATDSYILARVPVEVGLDETSGFLPVDAVKASRKREAGGLHCNGSIDVMPAYWDNDSDSPALQSFPRLEVGQWPHVDQLWPAGEPVFSVGINAGFLKRLAEALGAEDTAVTLSFVGKRDADGNATSEPDALRPIIVSPHRGATERQEPALGVKRAEGLIMPVRLP